MRSLVRRRKGATPGREHQLAPLGLAWARSLKHDALALVLLVGLFAVALFAVAPPSPDSLTFTPERLPLGVELSGVYGVERGGEGTYVWTKPEAAIHLPLRAPGTYEVVLNLQSPPQAGQRPLVVTLPDGAVATVFPGAAGDYRFTWTYRLAEWRPGDVTSQIDLRIAPYTPPGDARALGVIVRGGTVQPLARASWPLRVVLPWVGLVVAAYLALRLARCSPPGSVALVLAPLAIVGLIAAGLGWALPFLAVQATRQVWLMGVLLVALPGVAALVRRATARWSWAWGGWIVVAAVPFAQVAAIGWEIWHSAPLVPSWDEWVLVAIIQRFERTGFTLGLFWRFHNEHRIFLPQLLLYGLIESTAWNRPAIMSGNLALGVLALLLFVDGLRRRLGSTGALLLTIPASLLILSLGQSENWLFAFQLNFILATFGTICCCWAGLATEVDPRWRWAMLVLGALLASLSSIGGLCLWIAFLPIAFECGRRLGALWCGSAALFFVAYFRDFPGDMGDGLAAPATLVRYALAYLGAPVGTPGLQSVILAGAASALAIALACLLIWWLGGWRAIPLVWVCLAAYALANAALTTYGRATDDILSTLYPRYQSFAMPWWLALLGLMWQLGVLLRSRLAWDGWRRAALACLIVVPLLGGLWRTNAYGFRDGREWWGSLRRAQVCVQDYPRAADACLTRFYPTASSARNFAAYLEQRRWSVFADLPNPAPTRTAAPGEDFAMIETIGDARADGGIAPIARTQSLRIVGWAADRRLRQPGSAVYIVIDGTTTYRATYGDQRPDIAARLGFANQANIGFVATLPPRFLTPGRHRVTIRVMTDDWQGAMDTSREVVVEVRDE